MSPPSSAETAGVGPRLGPAPTHHCYVRREHVCVHTYKSVPLCAISRWCDARKQRFGYMVFDSADGRFFFDLHAEGGTTTTSNRHESKIITSLCLETSVKSVPDSNSRSHICHSRTPHPFQFPDEDVVVEEIECALHFRHL